MGEVEGEKQTAPASAPPGANFKAENGSGGAGTEISEDQVEAANSAPTGRGTEANPETAEAMPSKKGSAVATADGERSADLGEVDETPSSSSSSSTSSSSSSSPSEAADDDGSSAALRAANEESTCAAEATIRSAEEKEDAPAAKEGTGGDTTVAPAKKGDLDGTTRGAKEELPPPDVVSLAVAGSAGGGLRADSADVGTVQTERTDKVPQKRVAQRASGLRLRGDAATLVMEGLGEARADERGMPNGSGEPGDDSETDYSVAGEAAANVPAPAPMTTVAPLNSTKMSAFKIIRSGGDVDIDDIIDECLRKGGGADSGVALMRDEAGAEKTNTAVSFDLPRETDNVSRGGSYVTSQDEEGEGMTQNDNGKGALSSFLGVPALENDSNGNGGGDNNDWDNKSSADEVSRGMAGGAVSTAVEDAILPPTRESKDAVGASASRADDAKGPHGIESADGDEDSAMALVDALASLSVAFEAVTLPSRVSSADSILVRNGLRLCFAAMAVVCGDSDVSELSKSRAVDHREFVERADLLPPGSSPPEVASLLWLAVLQEELGGRQRSKSMTYKSMTD